MPPIDESASASAILAEEDTRFDNLFNDPDSIYEDDDDLPGGEEGEDIAAAATEDKEAPQGEEEKKKDDGEKTVPLASLLEERGQWKERYEALERRFNELEQQFKKPDEEKEEEPAPDFAYDPTGHLKHQTQHIEQEVGSVKEQFTQMQERFQQQQVLQQAAAKINEFEQKFMSEHEDYYDALEHVRGVERQKLRPLAEANNLNDEQLEQLVRRNELQGTMMLLQLGRNPAEYAYQIAKVYGYQPKAKEDAPSDADKAELDRLERGMKRSRSLGSGTGAKKPEDFGGDTGSIHEFDAAMAEMFGRQ